MGRRTWEHRINSFVRKKQIALLLIALYSLASVDRASAKPVSFGHNLTATSHVLEKHQVTLGLQSVAVGVTEKWSVGTSPWLLQDYNMYNLLTRYQLHKNDDYSQTLQFGYFKTDPGSRTYSMEAAWLTWVQGIHFSTGYNFFINAQVMYFFNERNPFSLRRPRVWRDPTEWTISTMHEVPLVHGFYLMGELGILGLIRKYPIIHTGATLQWRSEKSWLIQFGFSITGTWDALNNRGDRQDMSLFFNNGRRNGLGDSYSEFANRDFSMHPEFALQYFF